MSGHQLEVEVTEVGPGWNCRVRVTSAAASHTYTVKIGRAELERYGRGRSPDELARATFEFLLAREPPGSILSQFELSVVERYFPEFPREI